MLEEVMRHCHNYFAVEGHAQAGRFEISGGTLSLPFLLPGQYFRIIGSVLNDGVHQCGDVLEDEIFEGVVEPLAVPRAFKKLCDEIKAWNDKNGTPGPYQSESFEGYSYHRATNKAGNAAGWQDAFQARLYPWRKLP